MATFERFEDIQGWQAARALTKLIYRLTSEGAWARDFGLRDQIRRAAVSIMSNIAEGHDREGDAEFRHFLSVAKGSAAEVKSQLYVALDLGYLQGEAFRDAFELAERTTQLIGGLMRYLERQDGRLPTKATQRTLRDQSRPTRDARRETRDALTEHDNGKE